jgi:hypothetical protein
MGEQQRFTSVTSLLKDGLPKPAITYWAVREAASWAVRERDAWLPLAMRDEQAAVDLVKGAPWRESSRAAARGSDIHRAAEQINLGGRPDVPPEIEPFVRQYQGFLEQHRPSFLLAEAAVFNLSWSYAGTLDAVVELDGQTFVLDVKTTDKRPEVESRPPYPEVALQLAFYARATHVAVLPPERVTTGRGRYYVWDPGAEFEAMPKVSTSVALALVLSPVDWRLVPVRIDAEVWNCALAVREVARFQADVSKRVLGPV